MTDIDKAPVMLMTGKDDAHDSLEEPSSPGLSLADAAKLFTLELVFSTDEPEEEIDYLVVGKLEAANGYVGIQFVVCTYMIEDGMGHWWAAPDGHLIEDGLPMWDGSSGTAHCPFEPIKWARLPQPAEE
jgi:hypothetical protein